MIDLMDINNGYAVIPIKKYEEILAAGIVNYIRFKTSYDNEKIEVNISIDDIWDIVQRLFIQSKYAISYELTREYAYGLYTTIAVKNPDPQEIRKDEARKLLEATGYTATKREAGDDEAI